MSTYYFVWKIKLFTLFFTLLSAGGALSAALPAAPPAETVIRVGGTGSALGTMKQLADLYEKSHPGTRIHILPSLSSAGGVKAVLGGDLDLGLASRQLTGDERRMGAMEVEYARSPFVFITNAKINKKDITTRELEVIYNNPAASWSDGSRIRLILRPEKDIDTKLVRSLSPGMEQAVRSALVRPGMTMAITDQESADAVTRTPGALGAATLSLIISENRSVNVLSYNGVKPSVKSISDKSYPLAKSFYLVTTPKSTKETRLFSEFVRSPAAARLLVKTGNLVVGTK